jgi:hypothetical protein
MLIYLWIGLLVAMTIAVWPTWSYSRQWGKSPAFGIATTAAVFAFLLWVYVI